ncbi:MAG TPA: S9 family peptidase [Steroidobacteraceae bacterium]|nr:S9 family peptidase [Steroidobacteraceae bacterium]
MATIRPGAFIAHLLAACAALFVSSTAPAAPPSVADFAADTDFSFPTLSPDGTKVAYVTRINDQRVLVYVDLVKRQRTGLMSASVDSFDLSYCRFKGDDRLLCGFRGTQFSRGQPYPVSRLVSVDVTGKDKPRVLVQNGAKGGSQFQDNILDWKKDDPTHVLIELTDGDPFPSVHSLDITTGLMTVVQRPRHPIVSWTTDRAGVVRFGFGYDSNKSLYITRDDADSGWRTLAKWKWGDGDFDVIGFGPTPGTLLVSASHNGRDAIFEMDLTEKSDRQLLFSNLDVDVTQPMYWPGDHRIIGFSYETDRVKHKFFDSEAEAVYTAIDRALPDAENEVVSASRDGKKLLVASHADVRPSNYYVLDTNNWNLVRVGSANPALAGATLSPMKFVKIKAPDGTVLPGYVTLPAGSTGKNLPTIVYPHGGPHARDSWGYDPMVQFMASRGYAVIQVNFRGSIGYGYDWYEAGLHNWGTVMVDDITAATKWAIAEGIADPANTSIVGWSFGGYAALMSAVREPDLYRCAVSIAGVADLRSQAREVQRFYGGRQRSEYTYGDDVSEMRAGSPLRAAEKIKVPVLLVHGDNDIQVNVDQSKRMARALKGADKKVELVVIEDGDHSLSRFEFRQTLLTKLDAFLGVNAKVGGETRGAAN